MFQAKRLFFSLILLLCWGSEKSFAESIHLAIASNFLKTSKVIAANFKEKTGHDVILSSGSSGKLYAQIQNGAPYDLFLSADIERPQLLAKSRPNAKRFVYAKGVLVLWSRKKISIEKKLLKDFSYLSLPNPRFAPYGRAGRETLAKLKLWKKLNGKLVFGENVAQAFNYAYTGAAEMGFVSKAQVLDQMGSYWVIPKNYYKAIEQEAIQLTYKPIVDEFINFMKSDEVKEIIRQSGYGL